MSSRRLKNISGMFMVMITKIDFDIADVYKTVCSECFRLGACLRMAVSLDFIFDILAILSIDDNLIEIA